VWAIGEYSTVACFEGSQSGSSSICMLGPRMECPVSLSAAREMMGTGSAGKVLGSAGKGSSAFAVKREHLLAPVVGRRLLGCDVGSPVVYHLLGDTALNWKRTASSNFLFQKGLLLCKHVERRKGKRGGGTSLCIIGIGVGGSSVRRGLGTFVFLNQARVRVLEVIYIVYWN
jgi:hypothetical protein